MKKIIVSIVSAIILAIFGVLGVNYLLSDSPRKSVSVKNGDKATIEELSYYFGRKRMYGKIYRPADKNGKVLDPGFRRPVVIFLHEPLMTDYPERVVKSLTKEGVVGYVSGFRGSVKDIVSLVKRIRKEDFAEPDLIFLAGDSSCCNEVILAASKLREKLQGVILIDPYPKDKAREIYQLYGREFLTIDFQSKEKAASLIGDYLEERGALK